MLIGLWRSVRKLKVITLQYNNFDIGTDLKITLMVHTNSFVNIPFCRHYVPRGRWGQTGHSRYLENKASYRNGHNV